MVLYLDGSEFAIFRSPDLKVLLVQGLPVFTVSNTRNRTKYRTYT